MKAQTLYDKIIELHTIENLTADGRERLVYTVTGRWSMNIPVRKPFSLTRKQTSSLASLRHTRHGRSR